MNDDPYLIPGTETLRNRPGLTAADEFSRFEARMTVVRIAQLETDASIVTGSWDLRHLQRFHHHIFQDVFEWAGKLRTVDMAKDGNVFCRPQFIESAAADIFRDLAGNRHLRDVPRTEFVAAAGELLSAINSLYPFREGNGRTQRAFRARMAAQAGWRIDWTLLDSAQQTGHRRELTSPRRLGPEPAAPKCQPAAGARKVRHGYGTLGVER